MIRKTITTIAAAMLLLTSLAACTDEPLAKQPAQPLPGYAVAHGVQVAVDATAEAQRDHNHGGTACGTWTPVPPQCTVNG